MKNYKIWSLTSPFFVLFLGCVLALLLRLFVYFVLILYLGKHFGKVAGMGEIGQLSMKKARSRLNYLGQADAQAYLIQDKVPYKSLTRRRSWNEEKTTTSVPREEEFREEEYGVSKAEGVCASGRELPEMARFFHPARAPDGDDQPDRVKGGHQRDKFETLDAPSYLPRPSPRKLKIKKA